MYLYCKKRNKRILSVRTLSVVVAVMILTCSLGITSASAATFKINTKVSGDFEYYVKNGTVCITEYLGKKKSITIPEKVEKKKVVRVELCGFEGDAVNLSKAKWLKEFYAEGLFVKTLDLRKNTQLLTLDLEESGALISLDLSANKELQDCFLDVKTIKNLSVKKCAKLKSLCAYVSITKLDLSDCKSLKELDLSGTSLTSLSLVKNKKLKDITVYSSKGLTIYIDGKTISV
jgi:hypothetical protein